jgi:hypothetical protein
VHAGDDDRERAEQPALPAAGIVQKAERGTRVERERPVEKTRNHRMLHLRLEHRERDRFRQLVERDDNRGDDEPDPGVGFGLHGFPKHPRQGQPESKSAGYINRRHPGEGRDPFALSTKSKWVPALLALRARPSGQLRCSRATLTVAGTTDRWRNR